ncbi:hypothetical protein SLE2022_068800 [Rubroshorea leprosula]
MGPWMRDKCDSDQEVMGLPAIGLDCDKRNLKHRQPSLQFEGEVAVALNTTLKWPFVLLSSVHKLTDSHPIPCSLAAKTHYPSPHLFHCGSGFCFSPLLFYG